MRKFELLLPGDNRVTFTNKWWVELRQLNPAALISLLSGLGFTLLMGFVVLLPFIFSAAPTVEIKFAYYLLIVILGLLGCTIGLILVSGWRALVDPMGLVGMLVFALVSILAFLFAPATVGNTLGSSSAKYMGAIYLMVLIALFYFSVLFSSTKRRLQILITSFLVALGLMFLVRWLVGISGVIVEQTVLFSALQVLITSSTIVWLTGVLLAPRRWKYVCALLAILSTVLTFSSDAQYVLSAWLEFIVLIGLMLYLLLQLRQQHWQVKTLVSNFAHDLKLFTKRQINFGTLVARSQTVLLAMAVIGWTLLTVRWFNIHNLNLLFIQDLVNDYRNAFISWVDIQSLLVGRGAGVALQSNTVATAIVYQGVLGLIAYIVLIGNGLMLAVHSWHKTTDWKIKAIALWSMVASLLFVVTRVHIALVILWWISLAIMAASYLKFDPKSKLAAVKTWQLGRFKISRLLPRVQFVVVIILFVLWIVATRWLITLAQAGKI